MEAMVPRRMAVYQSALIQACGQLETMLCCRTQARARESLSMVNPVTKRHSRNRTVHGRREGGATAHLCQGVRRSGDVRHARLSLGLRAALTSPKLVPYVDDGAPAASPVKCVTKPATFRRRCRSSL